MSEAEFERRQEALAPSCAAPEPGQPAPTAEAASPTLVPSAQSPVDPSRYPSARGRVVRTKAPKSRRVQRMFAIDEDLDKKLWLYAIHVDKDRSEVVNELLRPIVASMVLYDSRDRRAAKSADPLGDGD
jgi:hypothetical protein